MIELRRSTWQSDVLVLTRWQLIKLLFCCRVIAASAFEIHVGEYRGHN